MLDFEWIHSSDTCYTSQELSSEFDKCGAEDIYAITEIGKAVETLNEGPSAFSFYDLHLNDYEHELLSSVKLVSTNFVTLYSLNNLTNKFVSFLGSVIEHEAITDLRELAELLHKITSHIIKASAYKDATISLIAYNNGLGEYFPTWHIDKTLIEQSSTQVLGLSTENVFIVTLKGDSTLYHEISDDVRQEFNLLANTSTHSYGYDDNLEYRPGKGIDRLFSIETSKYAEFGQGSVHLAGRLHGTIHSTPPGLERLVVIVKPYDKELIQQF